MSDALAPAAGGGVLARGDRVELPAMTTVEGRRLAAGAWAGSAVVIVFFETDCTFCGPHDERLERLSRAMRDRPLRVLGVARDRSVQDVQAWAWEHRIGYDLVLDPEDRLKSMFTPRRVVPFTVVLDRAHRLREVIPGAMSEEDALALAHWADAPAG